MLETFSTKAVELIDYAKTLAKQDNEVTNNKLPVSTYHFRYYLPLFIK